MTLSEYDINELIRAFKHEKRFAAKRNELHESGITDAEIVRAMASSNQLADPIGGRAPNRRISRRAASPRPTTALI